MAAEKILLEATFRLFKNRTEIWNSQHESVKQKLHLRKLTSFHDEITCSVEKGKAVDVAYFDFDNTRKMVSVALQ